MRHPIPRRPATGGWRRPHQSPRSPRRCRRCGCRPVTTPGSNPPRSNAARWRRPRPPPRPHHPSIPRTRCGPRPATTTDSNPWPAAAGRYRPRLSPKCRHPPPPRRRCGPRRVTTREGSRCRSGAVRWHRPRLPPRSRPGCHPVSACCRRWSPNRKQSCPARSRMSPRRVPASTHPWRPRYRTAPPTIPPSPRRPGTLRAVCGRATDRVPSFEFHSLPPGNAPVLRYRP